MFNLNRIKSQIKDIQKNNFKSEEGQTALRIIGDRSSGKTTYLAALARWPSTNSSSIVHGVLPINEATENLATQAQNILEQGLRLEPSALAQSVSELSDYNLRILLKDSHGDISLDIHCKDYAGEFFSDLLYRSNDSQLTEYLDDIREVCGIMFLIDGTSHRRDHIYANGLEKLLNHTNNSNSKSVRLRIAITLTKCEQPELWVNRSAPQKLAQARFPELCRKIHLWHFAGGGDFEYFATSAFGTIGTQFPEPNSKRISKDELGTQSVIKNPKRWRPFGLVAPLYWLCTGNRHPNLD